MQQMSDELIYGPYTEDQITCVVDLLSKNFLTVQDLDDQYKVGIPSNIFCLYIIMYS